MVDPKWRPRPERKDPDEFLMSSSEFIIAADTSGEEPEVDVVQLDDPAPPPDDD